MRILLIILFCFQGINILFSQEKAPNPELDKKIDSVRRITKNAKHDSLRINAYIHWQSLLSPNEGEEDYKINNRILSISERNLKKSTLTKNEKKYFKAKVGRSFSLMGRYYLITGDYSRATGNFLKALDIFKKLDIKKEIANCYSNIGVANIYKGNYPEALQYSLKALKVREEIGDTMHMAASYNNAAYLYMVLHKHDLSLDYNNKALAIYKKLKMEQDVAGVYINLGILYRNQNNYEKALEYYLKALPIKESAGDKIKLADLYNNISVAYNSLKNNNESLRYALLAMELHEETNNLSGISGSLANMASSYFEMGQYTKAKECLERSLPISKRINHKMTIAHVYLSLTMVDSALGNHKNSLQNYKMYIIYRDSLYSEENTRKAVEAELKYEFSKDSVENAKQKQLDKALIEKQNTELDAQRSQQYYLRTQQYFLFAGLAMLVVFAGIMYNRFRVTSGQKKSLNIKNTKWNCKSTLLMKNRKKFWTALIMQSGCSRQF